MEEGVSDGPAPACEGDGAHQPAGYYLLHLLSLTPGGLSAPSPSAAGMAPALRVHPEQSKDGQGPPVEAPQRPDVSSRVSTGPAGGTPPRDGENRGTSGSVLSRGRYPARPPRGIVPDMRAGGGEDFRELTVRRREAPILGRRAYAERGGPDRPGGVPYSLPGAMVRERPAGAMPAPLTGRARQAGARPSARCRSRGDRPAAGDRLRIARPAARPARGDRRARRRPRRGHTPRGGR